MGLRAEFEETQGKLLEPRVAWDSGADAWNWSRFRIRPISGIVYIQCIGLDHFSDTCENLLHSSGMPGLCSSLFSSDFNYRAYLQEKNVRTFFEGVFCKLLLRKIKSKKQIIYEDGYVLFENLDGGGEAMGFTLTCKQI